MIDTSIAIQVLPEVQGNEVIRIVDKVIDYLRASGLKVFVGPFETTVEGEFYQLMDLLKGCQLICIREGAPSVMSYVKISYHPDGGMWSIDEKVTKHHQ